MRNEGTTKKKYTQTEFKQFSYLSFIFILFYIHFKTRGDFLRARIDMKLNKIVASLTVQNRFEGDHVKAFKLSSIQEKECSHIKNLMPGSSSCVFRNQILQVTPSRKTLHRSSQINFEIGVGVYVA